VGTRRSDPDGRNHFTENSDFPLTSGDLLEQVVIQLQPLKIPDLRSENRARQWRNIAQSFNIQGAILLPLKYQDRCVGITLLGSQQWGITPSRAEEELLSIILGELAAALHRVETEWYRPTCQTSRSAHLLLTVSTWTSQNIRAISQCSR
jgi:GAF domain-containing protein